MRRFWGNTLYFVMGAVSVFILDHLSSIGNVNSTKSILKSDSIFEMMNIAHSIKGKPTQLTLQSATKIFTKTDHRRTVVYHFNGNEIVRLYEFCSWPKDFRCVMLNTSGSGMTPIHVHDLTVDSWVSRSIVEEGTWEGKNIKIVIEELKNDPTLGFIDIGSHVGVFSLSVAKFGRKVVSVDPLLENVQRLCKSVQKGNFTELVTIIFNPVSDGHRRVMFKRSPGNVGGTSIFSSPLTGSRSLCDEAADSPTVMLDDIIDILPFRRAVLKMDVQGHEYFVLKGASKFFDRIFLSAIMMEWDELKKGTYGEHVINFLHSYKFKAYELSTNGKELNPKDFRNWPYDILWKRSS